MDRNLRTISVFEIFDKNKFKELREKNHDIILDQKLIKQFNNDSIPQLKIRDEHMSQNIHQVIKERRKYLNSHGITSPLWCVIFVGGGHVSGISTHLLEFGYTK
ncbi:hypothetical protein MXB_2418, partial [Myxobolus squamalis]